MYTAFASHLHQRVALVVVHVRVRKTEPLQSTAVGIQNHPRARNAILLKAYGLTAAQPTLMATTCRHRTIRVYLEGIVASSTSKN